MKTLILSLCCASATMAGEIIDVMKDASTPTGKGARFETVLKSGELASAMNFKPPVKITYVAKTDSKNLRISYAADEIIFNWEQPGGQLRIGGGPAGGRHVAAAGTIPKNQFVTIVQTVLPGEMRISVDGVQRALWHADFSKVDQPIRVFPAGGSKVTVKALFVEQLEETK